jgi:4-azaleucine resistance transporter AzlC
MTTPTKSREFWRGVRDTLPLVIGAVPFGIIFGTLACSAGLSVPGAMAMSLFVFAGSAQFIAVGLAGSGTIWPMIVLTTFVVNFRHLLYTATLLDFLKVLPHRWQTLLAFGLTDETFAVAVGRWRSGDESPYKHWYQLGSMAFMYVNWNICTVIGAFAGTMLQGIGGWGLDFAMVATFIGMVIPFIKDRPTYAAVLMAAVVALLCHGLPHKVGLIIAAIIGMAAGVAAETALERNRR